MNVTMFDNVVTTADINSFDAIPRRCGLRHAQRGHPRLTCTTIAIRN